MSSRMIRMGVLAAVVSVTAVQAAWRGSCRAEDKDQSTAKKVNLYDTRADGNKQIADALKVAKAKNKRVLLKFGANWCSWDEIVEMD